MLNHEPTFASQEPNSSPHPGRPEAERHPVTDRRQQVMLSSRRADGPLYPERLGWSLVWSVVVLPVCLAE